MGLSQFKQPKRHCTTRTSPAPEGAVLTASHSTNLPFKAAKVLCELMSVVFWDRMVWTCKTVGRPCACPHMRNYWVFSVDRPLSTTVRSCGRWQVSVCYPPESQG